MNRQVTLYGRQSCPPCMRTKSLLEKAGVEFLYVDVDLDADALDGITDEDWVTALPVVVCGDLGLRWCGYRPEHVKTVVSAYGTG